MNPEENQNTDNNFSQPVEGSNPNPPNIQAPINNTSPNPLNPSEINPNQTLPENNVYVGMGGSDIKPEKTSGLSKLVIPLVIITVLLALGVGGIFAYQHFNSPPLGWIKTMDNKTGVFFFTPECDKKDIKDESASNVYKMMYACGVEKDSALSIFIVGIHKDVTQNTDSKYLLNSEINQLTQAISVTEKNNTSFKGNPAIKFAGTQALSTGKINVRGLMLHNSKKSNLIVMYVMGDNTSDQTYNSFINSLDLSNIK